MGCVAEHELVLEPLQWQSDNDALTIEKNEIQCLAEVQQILAKYKNVGRFGVAIIHNDFPLSDDEIMLETTNQEKREHWIRPVKKEEIARRNLEIQTTVIRFDKKGWNQHCSCARSIDGHLGTHFG